VTYSANGQVLTTTTRKSDTITLTYNARGQVATKAADDTLTHVYDIMGRLTSVTSNGTGSLSNSFTYDAASRVLTAGRQDSKTVSYVYDPAGNRTKLTHADSYYVDYEYDALNRMTGVKENGASTYLAEYSYDVMGRRTDLERRNGADTSYTFDLANRLTDLDHSFVGSVALEFDYGYNAVSQITSMTISNEDYLWSPASNVTENATVNDMNELTAFNSNTITYDANGNMTSDASQTYAYNKVNQMVSALVGSSTSLYTYDPIGRRVKKDVDGTVTAFLHDGGHEIVEYNGSDTVLRRYIYGPGVDERVAMVESSTTTYFHTNHQGSVVAMSDANGDVIEQYTYDEYGKSETTIGQPFRYTGRRLDPETGLYYYRARYYSPAMGRFMQVDPIGYAAGMNTHSYVGNDPMNMIDPIGLDGIPSYVNHILNSRVLTVGGEAALGVGPFGFDVAGGLYFDVNTLSVGLYTTGGGSTDIVDPNTTFYAQIGGGGELGLWKNIESLDGYAQNLNVDAGPVGISESENASGETTGLLIQYGTGVGASLTETQTTVHEPFFTGGVPSIPNLGIRSSLIAWGKSWVMRVAREKYESQRKPVVRIWDVPGAGGPPTKSIMPDKRQPPWPGGISDRNAFRPPPSKWTHSDKAPMYLMPCYLCYSIPWNSLTGRK
jgi:RHS repeat-associated protein